MFVPLDDGAKLSHKQRTKQVPPPLCDAQWECGSSIGRLPSGHASCNFRGIDF